MRSKKDNIDEYNNNEDLNFMPLNIESSLSPNSAKFPLLFNMDGISITKTYGAISLGFPNLNINPNPMPLNITTIPEMAPLTPYPKNIPNIDLNTSLNNNNNNTNNTNNTKTPGTNTNLFNTNSNNSNLLNTNSNNTNLFNQNTTELEYPTELDDDFLYSYNEPKVNDRYLENSVNILDILRNFDLSLDFSSSETRKNTCTEDEINDIFSLIEKNNAGILATMKAYRIPYPIAKLLIKKIIKISLDNCKR